MHVNDHFVENHMLNENATKTLHEIINKSSLILIFIESIDNKMIKKISQIISVRLMHFGIEEELE